MDHDEARLYFNLWLRMVHELAGKPAVRTLAKDSGVSHQTITTALAGSSWPRWDTVRLIAFALGLDRNALKMGWLFWSTADRGERIGAESELRDELVTAIEALTAAMQAQTVVLGELVQEVRSGRLT